MTDLSPPEPVIELLELQGELGADLKRPRWSRTFKLEVRRKLRKMSRLLRQVRERYKGYLGGDEVLDEGVESIREDVRRRIDNV